MIKILIVDDKTENIYLLQSMLDTNGFKTISAKNGAEALGLLRTIIPDLIIADILMPVMDGFTLCRECKKDETLKNIPFFFYTATYVDTKDEEYALNLGADRFILKPQEPDVFLKIINDFLEEVKNKTIRPKKIVQQPETIVLKEYNEVLIRKIEDKMLQTEKTEKELRKYSEELEREILEHKKSEAFLLEREQQLSSIYRTVGDVIFHLAVEADDTYRFISVNQAFFNITGLREEMIIGKLVNEIVPEPSLSIVLEKYGQAIKENSIIRWEEVSDYPNGKLIGDVSIAPVVNDSGKCTHLVGSVHDITKRKRAEEALIESEKKYRQLVTRSPDGIFIIDLDGKFFSANKAICESLKYTEEELLSMKILDIIPEQYHSLHRERLVSVMNGESTNAEAEYEVKGKDGISHFVEVLSVPYYKGEKIIGFQGIARDITERKMVEEVLRKSQQIIEGIMNAIPVRVFWKDENLVYLGCNSIFARDAGFDDPKDIIGKNDYQMGWHDQAELYRGDDQQVIDSGNSKFFIEEVQTTPTGKTITLLTSKIPLLGPKGEINGILGTYIDITDRKKSEDALRESEEKFRRIFENVQDMFFEASIDGIMLEVSPSVELISKGQYKRDDVIGKSMFYFIKDPVEGEVLMNILMERGFVSDNEILLRNRDGSNIPCSVSSRIYFDAKKRPEKIIGSMRDITERKNASDALKLAKEKAEESDRLKTAFLHNISHEVRTPMNAIVGFSDLIIDPDLTPEIRNEFIQTIVQSSNQLLSIITQIVNMATIETGQEKIYEKEISLNSIFRMVSEQFSSEAERKNITLEYNTGLATGEDKIKTDETKLIQIISNLIGNALKFIKQGSINFGYVLKDKYLEFYVRDTGIGIPLDMHEKIFERFRQVESTLAREYEGSGLGLSISKAYIELLGGKIWLTSKLGEGSIFYFTLPHNKVNHNTIQGKVIVGNNKYKPEKIMTLLVAEDDNVNFKLLARYLSKDNIDVIHASNGSEAVEICRSSQNIDLVLMDLRMPVMNGFDAVREIREFLPDLPIIAQTAYSFESDKEKALACGCNDFISKPFKKEELLTLIREHLTFDL